MWTTDLCHTWVVVKDMFVYILGVTLKLLESGHCSRLTGPRHPPRVSLELPQDHEWWTFDHSTTLLRTTWDHLRKVIKELRLASPLIPL